MNKLILGVTGALVLAVVILGWQLKVAWKNEATAKAAFFVAEAEHLKTKEAFGLYRSQTQQQVQKLQKSFDTVSMEYRASRAKVDELADKLSKHDFGMLVSRKPGLVERIVNRGTERVRDDLEGLTRRFSDREPQSPH